VKKAFALAALVIAASSASATTVTNWGTLDFLGQDARAYTTKAGTVVDDVYTFSLADYSDVASTANYYVATSLSGATAVNLANAKLTLYSGTYGDSIADSVVGSYSFGTSMTDYTFAGLSSGSYYFEVTGTATGSRGSDYYFDVTADSAIPPAVAVPEPANLALLAGGLGLLGIARRRAGARR
jgi:hypothetical protein